MHETEITTTRSKEVSIVYRSRVIVESSGGRSRRYEEEEEQEVEESPALMIYEILLSVIRKQVRKPFQLFKQFLLFSDEESSIDVGYKHPRFQLQIVEENIRSACTLIRQRLLVDGFITIKNLFLKKLRIQQAYYNQQNLAILHSSVSSFQTFFMKWEGFGRLYEHFRGNRLLKLNLSKIQAISNDYTSKQLEDFHPFLKESQAIHSYLIDRSIENDSADLHSPHDRYLLRGRHQEIKEHEEEDQQQAIYNRSLRKSRTEYDIKKAERDELDSKVLVTHRKEGERQEAGSTVRVREEIQHENEEVREANSQEIYLIRDYKTKGKKSSPSNFIKVPVLSENVKIVQILTGRKKTHKQRHSRLQVEIQQQICQNCKFCIQMRQRKEMMRVVERRFETVLIQSNSIQSNVVERNSACVTQRKSACVAQRNNGGTAQRSSGFIAQRNSGYTTVQRSSGSMVERNNGGTTQSNNTLAVHSSNAHALQSGSAYATHSSSAYAVQSSSSHAVHSSSSYSVQGGSAYTLQSSSAHAYLASK